MSGAAAVSCDTISAIRRVLVGLVLSDGHKMSKCNTALQGTCLARKSNILYRNDDFMASAGKPPCGQLLLAQECCKQWISWQLSECSS